MDNLTSQPVPKPNFASYRRAEPTPESFNFASNLCSKEFGNIGPVIISASDTAPILKYIHANPTIALLELQRALHIAGNLLARHRDLEISEKKTKEKLDILDSNFNDLQFEHNNLSTQHEAEMKGAQKLISTLNLPELISSTSKRRELSRPYMDPKFSGADNKLLTPFIRDLRRKLEVNADWWDTERLRIFYVASCFPEGSIAKKTVDSGFKSDGKIIYKSVDDIISLLKQTFGDVDESATAQRELKGCFQRNQPLATFLPHWMSLSELSGFNDSALISFLKDALHPDINNRLSFIKKSDIPELLHDFIALVREQDEILRNLDPKYFLKNCRKHYNYAYNLLTTTPTPLPVPQNIELTTSQGGDAMDLSSIHVNGLQLVSKWTAKDVGRKPTNDVEKAHRRAYNALNNLCIVCDSRDHIPRDCPASFQNRKKKKTENLYSTVIAEDGKGKDSARLQKTENV